jgi:hypothetical protein
MVTPTNSPISSAATSDGTRTPSASTDGARPNRTGDEGASAPTEQVVLRDAEYEAFLKPFEEVNPGTKSYAELYRKAGKLVKVTDPQNKSRCKVLLLVLEEEKTYEECRKMFDCVDSDLLAVAGAVEIESSVKTTVALVIKSNTKAVPLAHGVRDAWRINLPSKGEDKIKSGKLRVLREILTLECGTMTVNFEVRAIHYNAETATNHFSEMDDKQFRKAKIDALWNQNQQNDLSCLEAALVDPKLFKEIEMQRESPLRAAVKKHLGVHIYAIEPKEGVNSAEDLRLEYEKGGKMDFNTDCLEYLVCNSRKEFASIKDSALENEHWWSKRAVVICGGSGSHKTRMSHAKAKNYTIARDKQFYIALEGQGSIETLKKLAGVKGLLEEAGALVVADFQVASKRGALTVDELKGLFSVERTTSIESKRNHSFTIPAGLPKVFSFNASFVKFLDIPQRLLCNSSPAKKQRVVDPGSLDAVAAPAAPTVQDLKAYLESEVGADHHAIFNHIVVHGAVEISDMDLLTEEAKAVHENSEKKRNAGYQQNLQNKIRKLAHGGI